MQWIIRKLKISQQLLLVVFALGIPLALFAGEFLLDLKASAENRKNQAEGAAYIQLIKPVQLGTAAIGGMSHSSKMAIPADREKSTRRLPA